MVADRPHAKGSLCGYCDYCYYCVKCEQCPCESSSSKPACHMCKYCKFCYLCSAVCETVCKPGGTLDMVSSAIYNALPTFDMDSVTEDISSIKEYL
ncbi:uncharacterized protein LOC102809788 [Saccoglossus kowalevskii]